MPGNVTIPGMFVDLTDLEVTGDPSPEAGTPTDVKVSFEFAEPFYSTFLLPTKWPFTVKVYAEGIGDWAVEEVDLKAGTCSTASPKYQVTVPVAFANEGVYLISAIVELDSMAGFVMGWSDKEVRISAWTPQ